MSLETDLKQMIVEGLKIEGVRPEAVEDDAALFGEGGGALGLDSLDAVELVLLIQKRFDIEIQDMDVAREAFASIRTLADFIRARQDAS